MFTALLLADAVQRGEVALTDPVAKYLPATVKVPERGRAITLQDLATHTSGLPRLPTNMQPKDRRNPYADYSVEQMYAFLSGYQLTRDVGAQYEYSNLGAGLLGHVLARRAGMNYEALVETRITRPLGMTSTRHRAVARDAARAWRPGTVRRCEPVPNWDLPTLAGAGALRSTANDMLTFSSAAAAATQLGRSTAAFARDARRRAVPRRRAGARDRPGLARLQGQRHEIIWHNGGTGGYRTLAGLRPRGADGRRRR